MNIAMRDLDIRGAGNLLGGEQSGFMADIGFETYQKILDEAIAELKEEEFKDLIAQEDDGAFVKETVLETDFEILLPDDYVTGIAERISLYRELDNLENEESLEVFSKNLVDRFGEMPQEVEDLIETIRLRWVTREIGFEKLILKSDKMIASFVSKQESPYYQSDAFTRVLNYLKMHPKNSKMYEKNGSLRMSFTGVHSVQDAIQVAKEIRGSN